MLEVWLAVSFVSFVVWDFSIYLLTVSLYFSTTSGSHLNLFSKSRKQEIAVKLLFGRIVLSSFQSNPIVWWLSILVAVEFKIFMAFLPTLDMKLGPFLFSTLYHNVYQKRSIDWSNISASLFKKLNEVLLSD